MSRAIWIWSFLAALTLFSGCAKDGQNEPEEVSELTWPRVFRQDGFDVTVYDPQIESWEEFQKLKARSAIAVKEIATGKESYGVMEYEVETEVDTEERQVLLKNRTLTAIRMQGAPKEKSEGTADLVRRVLAARPSLKLSLDFALAYMEKHAGGAAPSVDVNLAPPPIFSSETPAILVIFQGEPEFKPVEGTGLRFAVNTNWDILFESRYYLLHGEGWLTTTDLRGAAWESTTSLPSDMSRLPQDENWSETRKAIPGKRITAPRVFVALEPSELIVIDGRPRFSPIAGTRLAVVLNTDSDLFRHEGEGNYYFLTSGRWFRAKSLDGPWFSAMKDLPEDFRKIPPDHSHARVRASVPGTPEASDAVLLAAVPRKATVSRKDVKVNVTYDGEPKFEAIEKTKVLYAVNSPYSVFKVGDRYYCCHEAVWFESAVPTGPWIVCSSVPAEIYTIPSTHPKYSVTYVRVYSSTPDVVVVGYTAGYTGMYVASGVVMFGMGLAIGYSSSYWHYHYPSYWSGYGCAARYNWYGGSYYRSSYAYGPYGGAGFSAGYNPATGNYVRGASAYGPYGSRYAAQSYNPYTGTSRARTGGSTPYSSWDRGVAVQGNDWARAGRYSDSRGTVAAAETSRGGRAVGVESAQGERAVVGRKGGDMYAGHDGNVYRRDEGGWQKYSDGNWSNVSDGARASGDARSSAREGARPSASEDTMKRLEQDAQSRDRGQQTSRQWNQGAASSRGSRGGRGGRR